MTLAIIDLPDVMPEIEELIEYPPVFSNSFSKLSRFQASDSSGEVPAHPILVGSGHPFVVGSGHPFAVGSGHPFCGRIRANRLFLKILSRKRWIFVLFSTFLTVFSVSTLKSPSPETGRILGIEGLCIVHSHPDLTNSSVWGSQNSRLYPQGR